MVGDGKVDEGFVEDCVGGLAVVVQVGGLAAGCVAQAVRGVGGLVWCRMAVQGAGLRPGVLRGPGRHIGYPGVRRVCCCAVTAAWSEGYLRGQTSPPSGCLVQRCDGGANEQGFEVHAGQESAPRGRSGSDLRRSVLQSEGEHLRMQGPDRPQRRPRGGRRYMLTLPAGR